MTDDPIRICVLSCFAQGELDLRDLRIAGGGGEEHNASDRDEAACGATAGQSTYTRNQCAAPNRIGFGEALEFGRLIGYERRRSEVSWYGEADAREPTGAVP